MFGFLKRWGRSCPTPENVEWVFEFNLELGRRLGGVVGVFNAFQDSGVLLSELASILKMDMQNSRDILMDYTQRTRAVERFIDSSKCSKVLLDAYWDFLSEAIIRMHDDQGFADSIGENTFTVMPDIFTHEVLVLAKKVTCKKNP